MRIPVYLVVAADLARQILEAAGLEYDANTGEGHPRIVLADARYLVYRLRGPDGTDTWTMAGNPSAGTGQQWAIYLLHPEAPRRARSKAIWERIGERIASPQNTNAQGEKFILGVYTPARLNALAPPAIAADVAPGGQLQHVIFGDDPVQLSQMDDGDLEE